MTCYLGLLYYTYVAIGQQSDRNSKLAHITDGHSDPQFTELKPNRKFFSGKASKRIFSPALLGNYDRQADRPSDRPTNRRT